MKILKWLSVTILILALIIGLAIYIAHELIPQGQQGIKAEAITDSIFAVLNKPAWDSLSGVQWEGALGINYQWNKSTNEVLVTIGEDKILINTTQHIGQVNGRKAWEGYCENDVVKKAFDYFNNDSFWLIAPYKLRDPGTIREYINYEGADAVKVQYTSGGTTPGDTYLWILNKNYRPIAWKFWVSIVPVGGIGFTWENWLEIDGAQISTHHEGLKNIRIKGLRKFLEKH